MSIFTDHQDNTLTTQVVESKFNDQIFGNQFVLFVFRMKSRKV